MRTNIDIDHDLMSEAMEISGARTKRETVEVALRDMIRFGRQQRALRDLRGLGWEGNLEEMRTDTPLPAFD